MCLKQEQWQSICIYLWNGIDNSYSICYPQLFYNVSFTSLNLCSHLKAAGPFTVWNTVELQLLISIRSILINVYYSFLNECSNELFKKTHTICLWLQSGGTASSHRAALHRPHGDMISCRSCFFICLSCLTSCVTVIGTAVSEWWHQRWDWQRAYLFISVPSDLYSSSPSPSVLCTAAYVNQKKQETSTQSRHPWSTTLPWSCRSHD